MTQSFTAISNRTLRARFCDDLTHISKLCFKVLTFTLWGGALPHKPIRDVPFFRVSFFSLNLLTEHKNPIDCDCLFKNNRLLFYPLFSGNICNLIIPKQCIEMQFFS